MPGTKGTPTTTAVPWKITGSTNKAAGGVVLSYTDPVTGKLVSYNFFNSAAADAWAQANVLILPPGARIVRNSNAALPGGASYDVVLADGQSATFNTPTEIGNWLVSKVGYATSVGRYAYEKAQTAPPAAATGVRDTQKGRGNPPGQIAPKTAPGSTSGGVTLEPTPQDSGIVPTDPYALPAGLNLGGGGGNSGGGGNFPGGGPALPADASPSEVEAYIRANYGYEAWMLDNPELRDLLTRSVKEGPWDDAKFQGELAKTTWWQQNGQSVFDWNALVGSDKATADRRVVAKAGQVGDMASSAGVTFGGDRLTQLATDSLRYGWNDDQIRTVIANEYHYQPGGVVGDIGAGMAGVKATAAAYLLPITDDQALRFAKSIFVGELTQQGLAATFAQQAAARFPALADSIANGVTPGQFFSTYQTQIGNLLEKPAESIDFLKDPRMQKVIDFVDAKGNRRPMTLAETENYVRTLPEWDTTRNARDSAYAFTAYLGQKFGKSA